MSEGTAILEITPPQGEGRRVELSGTRMVIGRQSGAEIQLESERVSRRHAELFRDPFGRWWVKDLGSRNGTWVNGASVKEHTLGPGDRVQVGEFTLVLTDPADVLPTVVGNTVATVQLWSTEVDPVRTARQLESPRIATEQLTRLTLFGRRLLTVEKSSDRMTALCELMVDPAFRGISAAVLRISRDVPEDQAVALTAPRCGEGMEARLPHVSRSALRAVAQDGEAVIASRVRLDDARGVVTLSPEMAMRSAVACPLRVDERNVDLLYVEMPQECGRAEWLTVANLAVDQYRLAEATWAARVRAQSDAVIEAELERAAVMQRRLVFAGGKVKGLDIAIAFEPCRWVGGDYVDVLPISEKEALVVIADVCGKGLPAALVARDLHTLLHSGVRAGTEVTLLPQLFNIHLRQVLPEGRFVTMVWVCVEPETGRLRAANFGHPLPVIASRSGKVRTIEAGGHAPLGLTDEEVVWGQDQIEPGELLAMFTDGVTELTNEEGGMLGMGVLGERLGELFAKSAEGEAAADLASRLTSALNGFQGDRTAGDDRTFLLLRRCGG